MFILLYSSIDLSSKIYIKGYDQTINSLDDIINNTTEMP